jgi:choline dehydrogenase
MRVSNVERDELSEAFLAAAVQAGYLRIPSFNGYIQEGFAYNQITLRNGRRCSTATAYIYPARRRRNLDVIVDATATRIVVKDGKAHKVEYRRDGVIEAVTARREIIVSSGVFNSPHLLQRSGIGPADLLRRFDIPVVANVPGVGENLQDHIGVGMTYECARPITINDTVNNPLRLSLAVAKYFVFRKGLLASTPVPSAGLIRTDPSLAEPDVKLQLRNWNRSASGRKKERMGLVALSSFGVAVHLMHPTSRGTVRLKSKDENAPPEIRFNFFTSERDRHSATVGQRETRKLMSMPAMRPYVVRELTPGAEFQSDDELVEHFRKRAISGHHATGSCRMGIDDLAAVDPRLRVRGVEGLRVIDASVMPRQVAANTNATTIMIAEKGAAMILEDAKAPARLSASVV